MKGIHPRRTAVLILLAFCGIGSLSAEQRQERFDRPPPWEGHNNRATMPQARLIRQDFGYSPTTHTGPVAGEIGGFITPDAQPAYYAKKIPSRTLRDPLMASGTLVCAGREFHVLLGFFNTRTLNEWRTPNTIALRLYGRGDHFYAYVEYMTGRWRAGADSPGGFATVRDLNSGRERLRGFASGPVVHTWSLRYDPLGNAGTGTIIATLDGETALCYLEPGHKADGAVFNRFGLLNVLKHCDGGGEVWLGAVTLNGKTERFTQDPKWEGFHNRCLYRSVNVRPRFDFGYSPTRYAHGKARGEIGGLVFRGDNRSADKLAYYADRLDTLTLDKPLKASGKVSLRRAVSDSTTLIGFFHSTDSLRLSASQAYSIPDNFVGIAVEGPSREGFLFYPTYGIKGDRGKSRRPSGAPPIYPDGAAHDWTFVYTPASQGGRITVTLDKKSVGLDLKAGQNLQGVRFDRFGIVTTWIDGNGQQIYFDDLNFTCRQE